MDESEWHQRKRIEALVYGAHLARMALGFMDTESTAEMKALVKNIEGITSKADGSGPLGNRPKDPDPS